MKANMDPKDEIRGLFAKHVPEIASGTVEIVALVRHVGRRSCLAVRSHDPKISAVDACTGERGARLKAMHPELKGEHLTVIQWDLSPERFIRNAFPSTTLLGIDVQTRTALVTVDRTAVECQMRGIIGEHAREHAEAREAERLEEHAALVSELTGWTISASPIDGARS